MDENNKSEVLENRSLLQTEHEFQLALYKEVIKKNLGEDVLEDSYVNHLAKNTPTLVAKPEHYYNIAKLLKEEERLDYNYLSELHGTDYQTHMEVFVYLFSFKHNQSVILKTKLDRDDPKIESLTSLWKGANWPECEAYDLLGIQFLNHPNLHRIFLGENWRGYPLRKDYVDNNDDFL